ncbi:hypothetical protein O6H91_20G064800 [Diphasiastrum complanatum]|uniref:Uncharacterized protein n=1 Tax=Diphasiastrum complanatum TaxID=34168 RepID=A0ACC2AR77_DIPCM|nr:hypothetical protein O6H91_20G064800 [Diphasiastrum complanatum]
MGSHGGPLLRSCKSINAESTGKKRDVKKILCDSVLLVCVALIALFCMEWWIISRLPGPSIAVESTEFSSVQWKVPFLLLFLMKKHLGLYFFEFLSLKPYPSAS